MVSQQTNEATWYRKARTHLENVKICHTRTICQDKPLAAADIVLQDSALQLTQFQQIETQDKNV